MLCPNKRALMPKWVSVIFLLPQTAQIFVNRHQGLCHQQKQGVSVPCFGAVLPFCRTPISTCCSQTSNFQLVFSFCGLIASFCFNNSASSPNLIFSSHSCRLVSLSSSSLLLSSSSIQRSSSFCFFNCLRFSSFPSSSSLYFSSFSSSSCLYFFTNSSSFSPSSPNFSPSWINFSIFFFALKL